MTTILAWLVAILEKTGLQWLLDKISAFLKSKEDVKATHVTDSDQAQQDMNKVEQLPPNASAEQEADAGSDALKHI